MTLQVNEQDVLPHNLLDLKDIFERHRGPTPISLAFYLNSNLTASVSGLSDVGIAPSPEFLEEVEHLLGTSTVTFQ